MFTYDDLQQIDAQIGHAVADQQADHNYAWISRHFCNFYGAYLMDYLTHAGVERFLDYLEGMMPAYRLPYRGQFREKARGDLERFSMRLAGPGAFESRRLALLRVRLPSGLAQRVLSPEELDALRAALQRDARPEHLLFFELAFGVGCKLSYMPKIRVRDLDLERGTLFHAPNNFSRKTVSLGPQLREDLLAYLIAHHTGSPDTALFVDGDGFPIGMNVIRESRLAALKVLRGRPALELDLCLEATWIHHRIRYLHRDVSLRGEFLDERNPDPALNDPPDPWLGELIGMSPEGGQ